MDRAARLAGHIAAIPPQENAALRMAPCVGSEFKKHDNPVSLSPIEELTPSETQSRNSGGTAGVLPAERKKATFNIEVMTNTLDGSAKKTARR